MKLRMTVLAAALCLVALPASATAVASPAGAPHAAKKSRSAHVQAPRKRAVTPHEACSGLGLSRKREPGQARSDFNACVVAVARGAEEGEEGVSAS